MHEEESDSAKEYFQRGVILFNAGDYKGALENFLKSYKMKPHVKIRYNIGWCYFHLGRNAAAANELEGYMLEKGEDIDPDISDQILDTLKQLYGKIGILYINVDAKGADIFVDNGKFGKSPLKRAVYVEPGKHTIDVISGDESEWSGEVDVSAGEKFQVNVVMKGVKKKAKVEKVEKVKVPAVESVVETTAADEKPAKKRKGISRAYFYAALGLTIAAAVVGSAAGGMAMKKSRDLDDLDKECREKGWDDDPVQYPNYLSKRKDLLDEANVLADVSTAFLVTSGILAASSILFFVFSRPGKGVKEKEGLGTLRPSIFLYDKRFALSIGF